MPKLILKCGDIEVEYDGSEEFIKTELPQIITAVAQLRLSPAPNTPLQRENLNHPKALADQESVSTLSQKLSVSNGPDLIVAAALSLARAGSESFTKKQLRDRSREAKTYFKSTYSNNFDNYVARLVKKGRLNHMGGENYSLPSTEQVTLESRLSPS